MKEFLEFLVKEIVSKPEEAKVTESKEDELFIYTIRVSTDDMGIVIGKEGKNIKSLRNVAKAKAIKDNVRIQIVIEDTSEL